MAERELSALLAGLSVIRHPGSWAFRSVTEIPSDAVMSFREREGWTAIMPASQADGADDRWAWLELSVFSDLHAVGLTAAVASALAAQGLPCNVVAAVHHDHVFVPEGTAEDAIDALESLARTP